MELVGWFLIGVALGVLMVVSLKRTVGQLSPEEEGLVIPRIVVGYFARFFVIVGALVLVVRYDALAAVVMVGGIWLGRWGMILFGLKSK